MDQNTHLKINTSLNGTLIKLEPNYAKVQLHTNQRMVADDRGLVHGGFAFGAADFAAMCAVNDPNVVLAASTTKFTAPIKLGQTAIFEARLTKDYGRKQEIEVIGSVENKIVFVGTFKTVILEKHVFDI